jgi:hypothetical protein
VAKKHDKLVSENATLQTNHQTKIDEVNLTYTYPCMTTTVQFFVFVQLSVCEAKVESRPIDKGTACYTELAEVKRHGAK